MKKVWIYAIRYAALFLLAAAVLLAVFDLCCRKTVCTLAEEQVRGAVLQKVSSCAEQQLHDTEEPMVRLEKDSSGRITALQTNMSAVNRFQAQLLEKLNSEVQSEFHLGVALGSLLFPDWLPGRGPQIPVRILSVRSAEGTFRTSFQDAGINQTLQRLILNLQTDVTFLVLGETRHFTVNGQVVLAETVIVGQVPNTFLHTGGKHG